MVGNYHRGFLRHRFADSLASRALKFDLKKCNLQFSDLSLDCNLQNIFRKKVAKQKIILEQKFIFIAILRLREEFQKLKSFWHIFCKVLAALFKSEESNPVFEQVIRLDNHK